MVRVLIGEHESEKLYASLQYMGVDTGLVETEAGDPGAGIVVRGCFDKLTAEYTHLIIPGGGDVDPSFFGQDNAGSLNISKELDELQFELVRAFVRAGKPVLGICRGSQVINVCLGGSLIQDLPTARRMHSRYEKDTERYHEAVSESGSFIYNVYGRHAVVNSSHHQGCDRMGEGLRVTMRAPDGVVEGYEHVSLPVYGVQWHPERMGFMYDNGNILDGSRLIECFLYGK